MVGQSKKKGSQCQHPECEEKAIKFGLCVKHYKELMKIKLRDRLY